MSPYLGGGHGDQGDAPAGAVGVTNGRVVLLDDVDHGAHPQGHQLISQDETLIPVPVLPTVKHDRPPPITSVPHELRGPRPAIADSIHVGLSGPDIRQTHRSSQRVIDVIGAVINHGTGVEIVVGQGDMRHLDVITAVDVDTISVGP